MKGPGEGLTKVFTQPLNPAAKGLLPSALK